MDQYGYPFSAKDIDEEGQESYSSSSHTSYHYTSTKTYSSNHGYQEETTYKKSNSNHGYPNAQDNDDFEFNQHSNPNYPHSTVSYGGMTTHHTERISRNEFYLHVDPSVEKNTEDFQPSNCRGKKRALLIGINYTGTKNELSGCINDVANIKNFITSQYDFKEEDMVILTDDKEEEKFQPTRANILSAMQWLVHDAEPNDSFFFHYSGHGGRVVDLDGDEDDNYDETIYPLDFESFEGESGQIIDDDIHSLLVTPLPPKCRLTAIFDSCHSGTVLDLPYVYSTKGEIKSGNLFKFAGEGVLSAGIAYATGDKDGALSSIIALGKQLIESHKANEYSLRKNTSQADVVMFSGCKDDQTSADAQEAGKATGAMSYAFTTALREKPNQSYHELLNSLRDILRDKYSQRPQMSTSHPIDVNLEFTC